MVQSVTIGIEKEYTCVSGDTAPTKYVLASPQFSQKIIADSGIPPDWRVFPAYSSTLLELVSPPFNASERERLLDQLFEIEDFALAVRIQYQKGPSISISDSQSVKLREFITPSGKKVNRTSEILLDSNDCSDLDALMNDLPPSPFDGIATCELGLRYGGFSSIHVTVSHPSWNVKTVLGDNSRRREMSNWMFSLVSEFRNDVDMGKRPYGTSNLFHYGFADWISGSAGKSTKCNHNLQRDRLLEQYGNGPYTDWLFKKNTEYSARPRMIGAQIAIEFRCFGSDLTRDGTAELLNTIQAGARTFTSRLQNV